MKGAIFPAVQCALGCRGTRVCNLITIALIAGDLFRFVPHAGFVRVIVGIATTFPVTHAVFSLPISVIRPAVKVTAGLSVRMISKSMPRND